ncbi:MAG: T9SS type A sorting domain-containing protein [Chitinophagaceae bacterium]
MEVGVAGRRLGKDRRHGHQVISHKQAQAHYLRILLEAVATGHRPAPAPYAVTMLRFDLRQRGLIIPSSQRPKNPNAYFEIHLHWLIFVAMKRIYLTSFICLSYILSHAQTINQTIDFNTYVSATNNDLVNNFNGSYTYTQSQTNGITGGAIMTSSSSGATAKYNNIVKISSAITSASISFKFDKTLYNAGHASGYAASIQFNNPVSAQPLRFSAEGGEISIRTTSSNNSTSFTNGAILPDGHWYQLKAEVAKSATPGRLNCSVYLYDLGTSGTSAPSLVKSRLNDDMNNDFGTQDNLSLELDAEQREGTTYLDNFNISAQSTGISSEQLSSVLTIPSLISNDQLQLSSTISTPVSYELYSSNGAKLRSGTFIGKTTLDCSSYPNALYIIKLSSDGGSVVRRIIKN